METHIENADIVARHFPGLTPWQLGAYGRLQELYSDWNAKINVISRADMGNLYTRHVLHSLAIAAFLGPLEPGTEILDLGTGGGFPGIPLAIFYPRCRFHLVDRIGKKIRVVADIAQNLGLANVTTQHGDDGECRRRFDYVVSRAVMSLPDLVRVSMRHLAPATAPRGRHAPGLVCLKGNVLAGEADGLGRPFAITPVADYFDEPFFETKEIVYVPLTS